MVPHRPRLPDYNPQIPVKNKHMHIQNTVKDIVRETRHPMAQCTPHQPTPNPPYLHSHIKIDMIFCHVIAYSGHGFCHVLSG